MPMCTPRQPALTIEAIFEPDGTWGAEALVVLLRGPRGHSKRAADPGGRLKGERVFAGTKTRQGESTANEKEGGNSR